MHITRGPPPREDDLNGGPGVSLLPPMPSNLAPPVLSLELDAPISLVCVGNTLLPQPEQLVVVLPGTGGTVVATAPGVTCGVKGG